MRNTDLQILNAEITTDPLARGYSGMTDLQIANNLNAEYRTANRDTVSGAEIFNATDADEYGALTDDKKAAWDRLCAIGVVDTASGVAKAREAELFGGGSVTRANLQSLRQYSLSRAAELGINERVYASDVTEAKGL